MSEDVELCEAFNNMDYETIFDITARNPGSQDEAKFIINEYIGENLI